MTNSHQEALDCLMPLAVQFLQSDPLAAKIISRAIYELHADGKTKHKRARKLYTPGGELVVLDADVVDRLSGAEPQGGSEA